MNMPNLQTPWASMKADHLCMNPYTPSRRSSPAVDLEVVCWVALALPDALKLSLHAHGEGDNHPAVLQVEWFCPVIGDIAQNQDFDGVVGQACNATQLL